MSLAILVAGLGYGDEGKGQTVDYLARKYDARMVVRYNGGAQAAHNVTLPDGRHHTFSQFGSASFNPLVSTHLSRFMTIQPVALVNEAIHLAGTLGISVPGLLARLTIDSRALVVTPFHKEINRLREESRGADRHGSCGMGIGECQDDFLHQPSDCYLLAGELQDRDKLRRKLRYVRQVQLAKGVPGARASSVLTGEALFEQIFSDYWRDSARLNLVDGSFLCDWFKTERPTIFEGAQGVLLDQTYGFAPYHSWSDTTFGNAYKLLEEAKFDGALKRTGVLRAYMTRHGAGPFVTEDPAMTKTLPDPHNLTGSWQGGIRVGHFDIPAVRYALSAIGTVDKIILTCASHLGRMGKALVALSYDGGGIDFQPTALLARQEDLTRVLFKTQVKEYKGFRMPEQRQQYTDFLLQTLNVPIEDFDISEVKHEVANGVNG